jgi:hypothetical protein
VELRGESHLEVAHAFGLAVLGQLRGRALQRFGILEDGHRVAKPFEVFGKVSVARPEDLLPEALLGLGGEGYLALARQLDQRPETQGAVEVDVEVGLGKLSDQVRVHV